MTGANPLIKAALAVAAAMLLSAAGPLPAGGRGEALFKAKGCYECHGVTGRGARGVAPALAPPRQSLEGFGAYVRRPAGQMPPYGSALATDANLAEIYAYLSALPKPRDPASIALLAPYVKQTTRASGAPVPVVPVDGAAIYQAHCAACHGAGREGGAGPSLHGEGKKRSAEQIVAFLQAPPPPMPKLYPAPLSLSDLRAVAAFVHDAP